MDIETKIDAIRGGHLHVIAKLSIGDNLEICQRLRRMEKERDEALAKLSAMESQDPVAWVTDDHLTDKSATTYSKEVAARWVKKGWPVDYLYKRPAPADKPLFQAACSGMWYQNPMACGEVSAVKIGDCGYKLPSHSQQSADCSLVPNEVIRFLCGEGELDGLWFGERFNGMEKVNPFWWRKHLPKDTRQLDRCPSHESNQQNKKNW